MKQIQLILNAILSKDIFEYILVDKELHVIEASSEIVKYLDEIPQKGEDVVRYLPELVGNEEEIKKIFVQKYCLYNLEAVIKKGYFVNITIEYSNAETAIILLHNITAITKERQKLLQYSNESTLLYNTLQKVIDNQNALIFVTEGKKIIFANKKFMQYFDVENVSALQKKALTLYKNYDASLENYDVLAKEVYNKECEIQIGKDVFIIEASDIESVHKLFALTRVTTLSNEVRRDALTGIYNKKYFNKIVKQYCKSKEPLALAVLDIDNFKKVNDTFGHLTGDKVLQEFVSLIQGKLGPADLFARWGGEEFLILFRHATLDEAKEKLEAIHQAIKAYNFTMIGRLTSSFGLTDRKEDDDIYTFIERADKALYHAKRAGKDKIEVL